MLPYRQRNAGAVIHTHSQNAVMATLLWPGEVFRVTHLEMIKVIDLVDTDATTNDESKTI